MQEDYSTKKLNKDKVKVAIENDPKHYPPVGRWKTQFPVVDLEKCIGCGQCFKYCPDGAILMKEIKEKKKAIVDMRWCKGCGVCAKICPVGAIKMVSKN